MRDVIEIAKQVYGAHTKWNEAQTQRLKEIAALVRADAIAEEREACAKLAESLDDWCNDPYETTTIREIAALIRARNNGENN